jgi:hypothetical protein
MNFDVSSRRLEFAVLASSVAVRKQDTDVDEAIRIAGTKPRLEIARLETERQLSGPGGGWNRASMSDAVRHLHPALKKPVFFLPDFQNPGIGRIIRSKSVRTIPISSLTASPELFNAAVFTGGHRENLSAGGRVISIATRTTRRSAMSSARLRVLFTK